MTDIHTIPEIWDYIEQARGGEYPVCRDQLQLCDLVERVFAHEYLTVDREQLDSYLSLQRFWPFGLWTWEKFCFALHNCTYRADGLPRWPDLFLYIGRGNGKNGYLAFEDFSLLTKFNPIREYHIDLLALSEDQSKRSFMDVYNVLEDNKDKLKKSFDWNREVIRNKTTGSELTYRTTGTRSADSRRPGKVDFDEYHGYVDYKLISTSITGLGKVGHARTTKASTDGSVRDGPLDHLLEQSKLILSGTEEDGGLLPFLCRLDDPKEVDDPRMWHKANPSLRYNPYLEEEIRKEYREFKRNKLGNADFIVKRMNCPMGNHEADVTSWDNILATNRPVPNLDGKMCVFGVDYTKTTDFLAVGLLFLVEGVYYWITHTWVCRHSGDLDRIKFPLEDAAQRGLLTWVDEVEIPPEVPVDWLLEQAEKHGYRYPDGAIDSFRHTLLAKAFREGGFTPKKEGGILKMVRPSDLSMSAPVLSSAFNNQRIIWGDNPLMRWYTQNTKAGLDARQNVVYGKKEEKSRKTDGFMALAAAMTCHETLERVDRVAQSPVKVKAVIVA